MSNMDELRYLKDVANDPALENAKRKFKKGLKKHKKKLKKGTRKSSELQTARKIAKLFRTLLVVYPSL